MSNLKALLAVPVLLAFLMLTRYGVQTHDENVRLQAQVDALQVQSAAMQATAEDNAAPVHFSGYDQTVTSGRSDMDQANWSRGDWRRYQEYTDANTRAIISSGQGIHQAEVNARMSGFRLGP